MAINQESEVPPGWRGGFHPKNLSSVPMLGNMDNIQLLKRQQAVQWPEFSWETVHGAADPMRCFQMFAPYISRLGYNNSGRVYSIICPQQGVWLRDEICLNAEVTVTGQRGWVDEPNKEFAADLTVEGRIWFTPNLQQGSRIKDYWPFLEHLFPKLPLNKDNAIRIATYLPGDPEQPIFPLNKGESKLFTSPDFAKHPKAWTVGHIDVEIGEIKSREDDLVDEFNHLVMTAFNIGSGRMLQPTNVLSWNVWFRSPQLVNTEEWRTHAERWRKSIDTHHGSPDGPGTNPKYFDGTPFRPAEAEVHEIIHQIYSWIEHHI